jgi:hypothetical protein
MPPDLFGAECGSGRSFFFIMVREVIREWRLGRGRLELRLE